MLVFDFPVLPAGELTEFDDSDAFHGDKSLRIIETPSFSISQTSLRGIFVARASRHHERDFGRELGEPAPRSGYALEMDVHRLVDGDGPSECEGLGHIDGSWVVFGYEAGEEGGGEDAGDDGLGRR